MRQIPQTAADAERPIPTMRSSTRSCPQALAAALRAARAEMSTPRAGTIRATIIDALCLQRCLARGMAHCCAMRKRLRRAAVWRRALLICMNNIRYITYVIFRLLPFLASPRGEGRGRYARFLAPSAGGGVPQGRGWVCPIVAHPTNPSPLDCARGDVAGRGDVAEKNDVRG